MAHSPAQTPTAGDLAPKLLAEFIGTFAFVFIGAGAAAVVGDGAGISGIGAIAIAHGLTIMVFAYAYGDLVHVGLTRLAAQPQPAAAE